MTTYDSEIGSAVLESPAESASVEPAPRGAVHALIGRWWVAFAASSLFVVSGHLLIKAGLNAAAGAAAQSVGLARLVQAVLHWEVITGLLIYILGCICWMIAAAQREISFLYPLSSINYVLVVIVSYVMFSEAISLQRATGVAMIVLGMVLMNRRAGSASA